HTRCLSDWSSDVCSSDLALGGIAAQRARRGIVELHVELRVVFERLARFRIDALGPVQIVHVLRRLDEPAVGAIERVEESVAREKIGRASCRERVEGWEEE